MARFDLSDFEWRLISPFLPPTRQGGKRSDDRRILNGIFYILRTGAPWRDLPERYGPYTTCYNRFRRWQKEGVWERIAEQIIDDEEDDLQMIDSSVVRVHQHGAPSKGGTGIHVWVVPEED